MLAVIEKLESGYIAKFNRPFKYSVSRVWAALTENDKLERWMPNLQIQDLRKGGTIKFDMKDGSGKCFDINILDVKEYSVLEYTWGEDRVRFELFPTSDGCLVILKEFISTLTDHTSIDLAGWHVCLDLLSALLDGHPRAFPKDEWEKWHAAYSKSVENELQ
ncbi:SRPBCC family protein [Bacillus ginsengihumi]|uniref:Activator of Hsp90 ATPase 1 family protein n=1 Tax=Heyndrickxia ginsengihumi TaxID=363870 RepID=A0A0A6VFG6_9BACI|nr:SRPBCC family protein [Heyndrickxia ginsengihumi]KHD85334.1 activator of Hsp90 ATPase 1 family protein [Heyndrickxia ginsengihumi]MBE6184260.1 SRPBCC family protein [Bacillus sp. (in: firmicutes)]MCM3024391.1 SRPBCC family protein [Heyndrickxia ginsengihumi]NEY21497.1 SRPBCC family protein [Heyndrickxia ginsengihumi]